LSDRIAGACGHIAGADVERRRVSILNVQTPPVRQSRSR
jgi:hypothetical protein